MNISLVLVSTENHGIFVYCFYILQVDIEHVWTSVLKINDTALVDVGIDLRNYYTHVEWDVMSVPALKRYISYTCCQEPFPDITFTIILRRKTLFYILNLIIPCVSINMLTLLAFYLPAESNEKISLSTSILLSLSLFQLLLMDSTPPTSLVVPLLGKYILFTMILVAASILLSVVTMNCHYRSNSMHTMSSFTRVVFLNILPKLLLMKRPDYQNKHSDDFDCDMFNTPEPELHVPHTTDCRHASSSITPAAENSDNNMYRQRITKETGETETELSQLYGPQNTLRSRVTSPFVGAEDCLRNSNMSIFCQACTRRTITNYPSHIQKAFSSVCFVAKHLKSDTESTHVSIVL